jgi:hypothetical protein
LTYRYISGEQYNESVPSNCKYADFMFKLSEKFKTAVSVKYQSPGEELDPNALITVQDDDDLQVWAHAASNTQNATRSLLTISHNLLLRNLWTNIVHIWSGQARL